MPTVESITDAVLPLVLEEGIDRDVVLRAVTAAVQRLEIAYSRSIQIILDERKNNSITFFSGHPSKNRAVTAMGRALNIQKDDFADFRSKWWKAAGVILRMCIPMLQPGVLLTEEGPQCYECFSRIRVPECHMGYHGECQCRVWYMHFVEEQEREHARRHQSPPLR